MIFRLTNHNLIGGWTVDIYWFIHSWQRKVGWGGSCLPLPVSPLYTNIKCFSVLQYSSVRHLFSTCPVFLYIVIVKPNPSWPYFHSPSNNSPSIAVSTCKNQSRQKGACLTIVYDSTTVNRAAGNMCAVCDHCFSLTYSFGPEFY